MSNRRLFTNFAAMRARETSRERFKREHAELRRIARQYRQRQQDGNNAEQFDAARFALAMGWHPNVLRVRP